MPVADTLADLGRLLADPDSGVVRDLAGLLAKIAEGGTVLSKVPTDDAFRFVRDVQFGSRGLACINLAPLEAHLSESERDELLAIFGVSPVMREQLFVPDMLCSKRRRCTVPAPGWNCIPGPGHCGPKTVPAFE